MSPSAISEPWVSPQRLKQHSAAVRSTQRTPGTLDDTVARNIGFGEEEPDLDKVMWAAQVANPR